MPVKSDEIRRIGEDIYLVHGVVIHLQCDDIDLSTQAGCDELIRHADTMFVGKADPEPWPGFTVAVLQPREQIKGRMLHGFSAYHYQYLPEPAKEILRKEFPDRADRI